MFNFNQKQIEGMIESVGMLIYFFGGEMMQLV